MGRIIYKIMVKNMIYIVSLFIIITACGNNKKKQPVKSNIRTTVAEDIKVPEFNADSAWTYINTQVNFGPRVPNTEAHKSCAAYLSTYFKNLGADVIEQKTKVYAYDKTLLNIINIIAQFDPSNKNRLLLFAHWDSRPFADQDEDSTLWKTPILGANDGASGVGVLMEIGRHFKTSPPAFGVDIILFDAEDYGPPEFDEEYYGEDYWCLGSQYWARNPHKSGYYARYGILLDMVGGKEAIFTRDRISLQYASNIIDKVWKAAADIGYGRYFSYDKTGELVDDHLYINQIARIPSINIIHYDPSTGSFFGSYWHTHEDNMDNIDLNTLKVVGQTIMEVVYKEK